MKRTLHLVLLLFVSFYTTAQVGINTDNSTPDGSAMLDIKSTDKGILIPRMITNERVAITSPAIGLLVYDTDTNSFWYHDDTNWVELNNDNAKLLADGDKDTQIQVDKAQADEDKIRFEVAASEAMIIDEQGQVGIGTSEPDARLHVKAIGPATLSAENTIGGVATGANSGVRWQSYTATTTGILDHLELNFHPGTPMNSLSKTITIYQGEGISGAVLGTTNAMVNEGWSSFPISDEIEQLAGQKYTLQIDNLSFWLWSNVDPYADGISDVAGRDYEFRVYNSMEGRLTYNESGEFTINNYTFPTSDGTNGQILSTDGAGTLSWQTPPNNITDTDLTKKVKLPEGGEVGQVLAINEAGILSWENKTPVGTVMMWSTNTPPVGWLICDGNSFDPTTYTELSTLLGSPTLPDFSNRFPLENDNTNVSKIYFIIKAE